MFCPAYHSHLMPYCNSPGLELPLNEGQGTPYAARCCLPTGSLEQAMPLVVLSLRRCRLVAQGDVDHVAEEDEPADEDHRLPGPLLRVLLRSQASVSIRDLLLPLQHLFASREWTVHPSLHACCTFLDRRRTMADAARTKP